MAAIEKTVVITGATSGLGQAAAVDFAEDGAVRAEIMSLLERLSAAG